MTIEQNAITSFKSRTTLVSTRANTVGPGLFLMSDRIIGGCDGAWAAA
jgi:glucosamine-6-phosphate deaminase